ncbi:5'-nucleotidase [Streptomyces sp. NPDC058195]|uniref:5'-nucleotidase n=1 Tax=Streptomyces sp. NPDC058195 TaxID=3346375 RepID=UPI0036E0BCF2
MHRSALAVSFVAALGIGLLGGSDIGWSEDSVAGGDIGWTVQATDIGWLSPAASSDIGWVSPATSSDIGWVSPAGTGSVTARTGA